MASGSTRVVMLQRQNQNVSSPNDRDCSELGMRMKTLWVFVWRGKTLQPQAALLSPQPFLKGKWLN
jgi:hypothetical protein